MGLTRPRLGQFQTTTTAFDDEIIVLNNSATGTNTNDIGKSLVNKNTQGEENIEVVVGVR